MEAVTTPADELHIDRRVPVERIPLAPSSWVDLVPGFVRNAGGEPSELHESAACGSRPRCSATTSTCPRTGSGWACRTDAKPLLQARPTCTFALGIRCRSPVSRRSSIATGRDFQGLHSDREMRWLDDTVIVIGGARRAADRSCFGRGSSGGFPSSACPREQGLTT